MGLLRRTPSGEDQEPRKQILRQNMEGFSLSMSSDTFNEELMYDLEEIVNKDLEKDPDFVSLYSIGSNHKGFERQPSVIMWENEPEGKFRVINSTAFAQLWAVEKKNPAMNYEKLSRAMRYYYRNKEIEMVKG